jgi:hypothetical protein
MKGRNNSDSGTFLSVAAELWQMRKNNKNNITIPSTIGFWMIKKW